MPDTITLRDERAGKDTRHLWARVEASGDLVIEGQDLGPGVESFWGAGLSEYEWTITVRAPDVPKLIAALGGRDGDGVLSLLAARFREDDRYASKGFIEEHAVPLEFWSRVGD